jgi:hypothetical protein
MRVMTVRWRMRLSRVHNLAVCLVVLLAGAFVGAACAARSVNDVMADPGRYRNRDVNVAGEVTESVGVLGKGFFKLQDESGALWVYTSRGLPRKGARVSSRGTIRDLASIDSVPDSIRQAVGSGLLLVESDRKAQ